MSADSNAVTLRQSDPTEGPPAIAARLVRARRLLGTVNDEGRATAFGVVVGGRLDGARGLIDSCGKMYIARFGSKFALRLEKVPFALILCVETLGPQAIGELLMGREIIVHDAARVLEPLSESAALHSFQVTDTRLLAGLNHYATTEGEPSLDVRSAAGSHAEGWSSPPADDENRLAAFDATLTQIVHDALPASSLFTFPIRTRCRRVLDLEHFALPAMVQLNANGVRIDRPGWEVELRVQRECDRELAAQLCADLGVTDLENGNQVRLGLRRFGIEVSKPSAAGLARWRSHPVVANLFEYRRVHAFIHDLGPRVLERIDSDGRVRAYYDAMGAATGRMASSDPNVMAIPRSMRRFVVPDPECVFVDADYSTIEIRLVAALTKEPTLIDAFREGVDVHRLTASKLLRKPYADVSEEERRMAKPINFGWLYGMSSRGFVDSTLENYGIAFELDDAEVLRKRFFAAYPGIAEWHRTVRAATSPRIVTASGRLRVVPSPAERDPGRPFRVRANTVIQGSAADGMKYSLGLLARVLPACGARLVATVHDQVLVEVSERRAEEVRDLVVAKMKEGMSHYVSAVPIDVDAKIKRTWGG